jgi:hypothetical protein
MTSINPANSAGANQQMEVTMNTERPARSSLLKANYAFVAQWFRRCPIPRSLRMAGPYLLIELLLPGGTMVALLLYAYRSRKLAGHVALAHS